MSENEVVVFEQGNAATLPPVAPVPVLAAILPFLVVGCRQNYCPWYSIESVMVDYPGFAVGKKAFGVLLIKCLWLF